MRSRKDLDVRYDWQPKTSDPDIAKRVADILDWDVLVPKDRIEVTVENGVVKLSGKVDWGFQRDIVFEDASKISGVVRIDNQIEVAPQIKDGGRPKAHRAGFRASSRPRGLQDLCEGGKWHSYAHRPREQLQ